MPTDTQITTATCYGYYLQQYSESTFEAVRTVDQAQNVSLFHQQLHVTLTHTVILLLRRHVSVQFAASSGAVLALSVSQT